MKKKYKTFESISSNNYVFLYKRMKEDLHTTHTNDRVEESVNFHNEKCSQPPLIVCKNCKKKVESLQKHLEKELICRQVFLTQKCKVNLPRIRVSEVKKKSKDDIEFVVCPNCKETVVNKESLETSFIWCSSMAT